jgi:hypothetical protein
VRHVADVACVVESPLLVRGEKLPGIEAHAVTCRWNVSASTSISVYQGGRAAEEGEPRATPFMPEGGQCTGTALCYIHINPHTMSFSCTFTPLRSPRTRAHWRSPPSLCQIQTNPYYVRIKDLAAGRPCSLTRTCLCIAPS